jgi:drug/metabolite transporter (DMT)-like permease
MNLLSFPAVQCMICAFGFSFWSIAQKLFGLSVGWAMVIVTVVQFPAAIWLLRLSPATPSVRSMVLFALVGAIPNAIGIVSLGNLLNQKGEVITTWMPVMAAMMPIVSLVGGTLLLGEIWTLRKAVGVGIICLGICVMSLPIKF